MAVDPRKRQKQQQRKAAKRKEKQREVRSSSLQAANPSASLAAIDGAPLLLCWAGDSLEVQGIGQVGVARLLPRGMVAYGSFLVDRYCLGVKGAFLQVTTKLLFTNKTLPAIRSKSPYREVTPANARRFVEDAVAYAQTIGFGPHPDYHKAKRVLDDIDMSTSTETLEFGRNGKPFYVSGPYDDAARISRILGEYKTRMGPDSADVLILTGPSPGSHYSPFDAIEDLDDDDPGDDEDGE